MPPYEQTAALCGMRFLPPLVLYGAHAVAQDVVTQHIATFSQRLGSYPHWPEMDDLEQCAACVVPMKDRPAEADQKFFDGPPLEKLAPLGGSALHEVKSVGAL